MKSFLTIIIIGLSLFIHSVAFAVEKIPVIIVEDHYKVLMQFLEEDGRPLKDIDHIKATRPDRILADQVLMARALRLGGIEPDFKYIVVANSARERTEVKLGYGAIAAQDQWVFNFDTTVYMTRPVIPKNTFCKGVFSRKDHQALAKVRTLEELREYTAIYDKNWPEWDIIEGLNLKKLYQTSTTVNMFRMVDGKRVDFTFAEIPNSEEKNLTCAGITLYAVKGIKIVVPSSRNFMVSKKHPRGKEIYAALNKGLAILHKEGVISQLLEEVGVINSELDNWHCLN